MSFIIFSWFIAVIPGGYGLFQDLTKAYDLYTEAAISATQAMQGKLANKYYELAEQCV